LPVVNKESKLEGVVNKKNIANFLTQYKIKIDDNIKILVSKDFKKLSFNDPVKYLSRYLIRWNQILVEDDKLNRFYIVSHDDLLNSFLDKEDVIDSQ